MPNTCLQLALSADQNYVDGLVATLSGVASHLPRTTRAEVSVIDCGIHAETRQRVSELVESRFPNLSLVFLPIGDGVLARLPFPDGLEYANRSVYARLFLPDLLPGRPRVIYLDCDLLVDVDISELAALALDGAVVAAAVNEEQELKSDAGTLVFNFGVMVMDLQLMRESELTRCAVEMAGKQNTRHGDQTLLNALLRGKWKQLDRRWNRQVFLLPSFSIFRTEPDTIWHVYMGRKPWHFHRAGARGLVAEYYQLLNRVGWTPTFQPQLSMNSSPGRDLLKGSLAAGSRSWRKLRGPAPTLRA